MKRLVAMVVAAGAAMVAVAMPTKAELQKAQEMVSDVTASDVAALKAKTKTPAEVAAKHMELAGQSGSEAEKYLLLQAAFKLYAKAGDYDAAANVIEKLQTEITNYDPEVTVELCGAEFIRKMRENAPRLYALKENARRIVFYRKQLPIREAAVKKSPKDAQAQRKLAECHAELGDWPKALEVFVKAGGELKKMAEGETSGKVPAQELGDFWWDYETKSDTPIYKLHAAELYRKALADDSFKGLARTRAEQRVKEVAEVAEVAVDMPTMNSAVISSTDVANVNVSLGSPFKTKGNESVFDFGGEFGKMEFVRCPPGKVKMRLFGNHKTAEVKISRPFWIQKSPMVIGLVKTVHADTRGRNNAYQATLDIHIGGIQRDFANRFVSALPPGYVVRLPTLAEIQYAYHANAKNRTDPYYDLENFHSGDAVDRLIFMQGDDNAMRGKTRPNAWGIFDFGRFERTLDRFAPSDLSFVGISSDEARQKLFKHCQIVELPEPSAVVDPLYWGETAHEYLGVWFCPKFYAAWTYGAGAIRGGDEHTFYRFVIGPDLVTEKTARPDVSTTAATAYSGNKKFSLAQGIDLEMVACPAGTFKMSNAPGGPNGDGTHEVKLTRTYWIASLCVTRAMYKVFEADYDKDEKKDGEKKPDDQVTGYARAEAFASWLNKRFQSKLPHGYVFRLPSEAEWEYAMNTGAVARHWNFEGTLDTVRAISEKANTWKFDVSVMDYAAKESDPLRICGQNPAWVCRQSGTKPKRFLLRLDGPGCFRMVVGPDLIAEKTAKK